MPMSSRLATPARSLSTYITYCVAIPAPPTTCSARMCASCSAVSTTAAVDLQSMLELTKSVCIAGDMDPATAAFYASYASVLVDGAEESAHPVHGTEGQPHAGHRDGDIKIERGGREAGERCGAIPAAEVRSVCHGRLRTANGGICPPCLPSELADRPANEYTALDLHDVSWFDSVNGGASPTLPRMHLRIRKP
ncbi:hypothetical protein BC834DRAFT_846658 [Gloeopeniophorella convolvens]|nr:hypothetical protein BC834DRAFT_846658 [Gloeopeniophorella convolvens]